MTRGNATHPYTKVYFNLTSPPVLWMRHCIDQTKKKPMKHHPPRIISLTILAAYTLLGSRTSHAQNANAIGVNLTFGTSYNSDSSTVGSLVPVDPAGAFLITNW